MRRIRFSDEQIIAMLKEPSAGLSTAELCRKHGISDATFYKWRSRYGGMEPSDAKRLRSLEEENARLKKLLAESVLAVSTLREMLGKTSDARFKEDRRDLGHDRERLFAAPRLRAGRDRAETVRYVSTRPEDGDLRDHLKALADERRRFGYRRLHILLQREGVGVNHKKLFRLYREERPAVRRRGGRKRALGTRAPMAIAQGPNQRWSTDFVRGTC